jgi:hypothetical protein
MHMYCGSNNTHSLTHHSMYVFCRTDICCGVSDCVYCYCNWSKHTAMTQVKTRAVPVLTLTADVLGCIISFHSWVSQLRNSLGRAHQNSPGLGAVNRMLAICHAAGTLTSATSRTPLSCHRPNSPTALRHASSVSADILTTKKVPGTRCDAMIQTLPFVGRQLVTEICLTHSGSVEDRHSTMRSQPRH